jgi:polyisoprenoid-binding protein YceI
MKKALCLMIVSFIIFSCNSGVEETSEASDSSSLQESETTGTGDEFKILTDKSGVQWIGSKLTLKHEGTINIQEGEFWIKEGKITAGRVVLDMNSITVSDLEGKDKEDLETHLKDTDFFEAHEFPTGKFVLTEIKDLKDSTFTHEVSGNLSLKGISKRISFPAVITIEGDNFVANANFNIDRSKWGIVYKGRLDNIISDEINLNIMIQASSVGK